MSALADRGAKIRAHDPTVHAPLDGVESFSDQYDACDGGDALVVLTEWDQFRWADLAEVGRRMARRSIVDARNLLDRAAALRNGFDYVGVGR